MRGSRLRRRSSITGKAILRAHAVLAPEKPEEAEAALGNSHRGWKHRLDAHIQRIYANDVDVRNSLRGLLFEWDSTKARTNVRKHGISFETACEIFFDPLLLAQAIRTRICRW